MKGDYRIIYMVNLYANIDLVEINTLFAFLKLDMIHDFHSTLSKSSGWVKKQVHWILE